jgi:hypothetical protein
LALAAANLRFSTLALAPDHYSAATKWPSYACLCHPYLGRKNLLQNPIEHTRDNEFSSGLLSRVHVQLRSAERKAGESDQRHEKCVEAGREQNIEPVPAEFHLQFSAAVPPDVVRHFIRPAPQRGVLGYRCDEKAASIQDLCNITNCRLIFNDVLKHVESASQIEGASDRQLSHVELNELHVLGEPLPSEN